MRTSPIGFDFIKLAEMLKIVYKYHLRGEQLSYYHMVGSMEVWYERWKRSVTSNDV